MRFLRRPFPWRRVLSLLVLGMAGLGLWLIYQLSFPARSSALAGTPYVLRVQPGVPDYDVRLVTEGLRFADRYFWQVLGLTTKEPIDVKLARFSPCIPFLPLRRSPSAVADRNELCINTVYQAWPQARRERALAVSIVAHEHFHNVQGQLNCLPRRGEHEYAWWVEGSATYLGWRATLHARLVTRADIHRRMLAWGERNPDLRPLREYERAIQGDAAYALAARAVEDLVRRSGSERSLATFCQRVGQGVPWATAFEGAFGLAVGDFYTQFERQRMAR